MATYHPSPVVTVRRINLAEGKHHKTRADELRALVNSVDMTVLYVLRAGAHAEPGPGEFVLGAPIYRSENGGFAIVPVEPVGRQSKMRVACD